MKILLSADTHGKIPKISGSVDLALIAGDFAKGDALRRVIFEKGSEEDAKREVVESSREFFKEIKKLDCPVVVSLGNAEDPYKKDVVRMIREENMYYSHDGVVEVKGLRILCIDFFVEEWWAKKYRPERESTIERGRKEEKELIDAISGIERIDIIISHIPPYGILDLSEDNPYLKLKGGHIGSKVIRNFIEEKKPKLVVCGHLHLPGEEKLGNTVIINPGEEKIINFDN